jgi:hypothetical protein
MNGIDEGILEDVDAESNDDESENEGVAREDDLSEFFPFLPPLPDPFALFGTSRRPRVAPRRSSMSPFQMTPYVTQPQFARTVNTIRADINKNSAAINTLSTRVATVQTVNAQQNRALAKQSKINSRQTNAIERVRRDLQKTRDMNLIMFLLTQPKLTTPTTEQADIGGAIVPVNVRLPFQQGDSNALFLSLALMGGFGDSGSDSNMMPLLFIAMAGGLG